MQNGGLGGDREEQRIHREFREYEDEFERGEEESYEALRVVETALPPPLDAP
jgi:hypothetical protein